MADSINIEISDRLIERQIQAGRVETDLREKMWAILVLLESDILSSLKSNDPTQWALLARRRREVQRLMAEDIDPLINERYQRIAGLLDAAMLRLATNEAQAVQTIVNDVTEEPMIQEQPSQAQLRAGVMLGLFPSATKPTDFSTFAQDWWKRQGESLSQRMGDSLTVGVALEGSLTDLARRVRGSADNAFVDGLMGKAKQDASRLLATQVTNALGEAHAAVGRVNPDQGLVLVHSSILDSKTSTLCLGRHGLRYTIEHEPIGHSIPYLNGVPYHPNCRSSILTVLRDGGPIRQEDVAQWLRRRGPAFQDEVLGPTRARMFRDGTLGSPRNLLEALTGRPLTLEELGA